MRLTEWLAPFFHTDEIIHGRAIGAKKLEIFPPAIPFEFTLESLKTDSGLQRNLKEWNQKRGIYFVVNAGGNTDEEITRVNAVFCEIDNKPLQEQHDILDSAPIPPTIRVETRKSVHAYWLLGEYITPNDFTCLQKGLIKHFNSDKSLHNPSRLMRLPFFNHVHYENKSFDYKRVEATHYDAETRFSYGELFEVYPYIPPPKPVFKNINAINEKHEQVSEELRQRIQQTREFTRSGEYGHTRGICHDGEGNTGLYIHFPTGAVKCFSDCSWHRIAEAFGIDTRRNFK